MKSTIEYRLVRLAVIVLLIGFLAVGFVALGSSSAHAQVGYCNPTTCDTGWWF